jgi:integrase/recombinase XerD
VTHLRQLMIEELQRRNFAESTIRSYVHGVEQFSRYFHRRSDRLGPQHIRQYQAMLLSGLQQTQATIGVSCQIPTRGPQFPQQSQC